MAQEWCDAVSADDVAFLMPVPIGVICQLRGKVVFTHGPLLRVRQLTRSRLCFVPVI